MNLRDRVNFKPFYHTKDIMTVIFIVMIDNCLLSTASDKGAQSFLVKSFKSRLFFFKAQRELDHPEKN